MTQTKLRPLNFDDLANVRVPPQFHATAASPDGRYLAYALRRNADFDDVAIFTHASGAPKGAQGCHVWITDLQSGATHPVMSEDGWSWGPSWNSDGSSLAFFADHSGVVNLWCWDTATQSARKVSSEAFFSGVRSDCPIWSADSKRIYAMLWPKSWRRGVATTFPAYEARPPDRPSSLNSDGPAVIVLDSDTPFGDFGGSEDIPDDFCDVGAIDLQALTTDRILSGFSFQNILPSPDGKWIALTGMRRRPEVSQWLFVWDLYLMPGTGGTPKLIAEALEGAFRPAWSPDSTRLALVKDAKLHVLQPGNLDLLAVDCPFLVDTSLLLWHPTAQALVAREASASDKDKPPGVYVIPTNGGDPRRIELPKGATILARQNTSWAWSPDGKTCLAQGQEGSTKKCQFWRISLDGEEPVLLAGLDKMVKNIAFSTGPVIAFSAEDGASPPDFWVTDSSFSDQRQVTHLNSHLDDVALGSSRPISWRTEQGKDLSGVLMLPAGYQDGDKVPVVAEIYPSRTQSKSLHAWNDGSNVVAPSLLTARGIAVFLPDDDSTYLAVPSGGTGASILSGISELVRMGIADPERLGVMGNSGGGLMVNRIITETTLFKAAVSSAGVADFVAAFGQLPILPNGDPLFHGGFLTEAAFGGKPWEVPERYMEGSPIFYLDKVQTPLMIVHGTEDKTVSVEQANLMYVGMRRADKKVTLLLYRGEGHGPGWFRLPSRRDAAERIVGWFEDHLSVD